MSDFQSIASIYRKPVITASGIPLTARTILRPMREKTRSEYGARLVEARKHAGLTQVQLAKKLKISQSTLAEAETTAQGSGYTPQFAVACGVSPVWLATGDGPRLAASRWPGTQFTLDQIHAWPEELIRKVEDFAAGYLAALENPNSTVQKASDNEFTVDDIGTVGRKLPPQSKQGQMHGTRTSVPASKRAKG